MFDKPKPEILDPKDALVRVTMSSICSSDLHIKHGSVPRAVPGITVGQDGRCRGAGGIGSLDSKARRPCHRQCRDLLRRVLLLQEGIREQLYRS